jgi:hypothetical protein
MSLNLVVNGTTFQYPETGNTDWGNQATLWANAVTNGMLQKAGGLFELTDDVDFGSNFGLFAEYFSSRANQAADVGVLRLTFQDTVVWRTSGDANLLLGLSSDDLLAVDGRPILLRPFIFDSPGDITLTQTDDGTVVLAQTSTDPVLVTMPAPLQGLTFTIKDGNSNAASNNITITFPPGVKVDNVDADLTISANNGWVELVGASTGYYIIGEGP